MPQMTSWKKPSLMKLFTAALAAAAAVWVSGTGPLMAHEVVLVTSKRISGKPFMIPVARPGDHLSLSPAILDFGTILVNTTSEQVLTLVNVTPDETLNVAASTAGPVTISPSSLTLLPGESAQWTLTYSPTAAGVLAEPLRVTSSHSGVGAPVTDQIELLGTALAGPDLELRIGGLPATSFDFGEQSRRPYTLDDAPQFSLDVVNVGDMTANVSIGLGPGFNGIGSCSGGNLSLCVASDTAPTGIPSFSLVPGASEPTTWRLFVNEVGTLDRDVEVRAIASLPDGTQVVRSAFLAVTAEGVPYLMPLGAPVASSAVATADGKIAYAFKLATKSDPLGGDNVDSASNDPFASFRPKGFNPLGVFQSGDVDNVEVQSGNLTVAIPIGQRFTARGALSYGLTAHFSSNIWSRKTIWVNSDGENVPSNSEYPDPANNTGMGWSFHLGRLLEPIEDFDQHQQQSHDIKEGQIDTGVTWVYISPDGSQHRFSRDLNRHTTPFNETATPISDLTFLYTRDGSHLRLRRVSALERHLELPSGEVHVFRRFARQLQSHRDTWRLVEIFHLSDTANPRSVVTIEYQDLLWTISDPWRSHTVMFTTTGSQFYPTVVDKVLLQGFNGGLPRIFDFSYTLAQHVERPVQDRFHRIDNSHPSLYVDVPILDSITLPDGTAYRMTYDRTPRSLSELQITELETPTGARIRYEYRQTKDTTVQHCIFGGAGVTGIGVGRRYVVSGTGEVLSDTRYLRETNGYLPDAYTPVDTKSPCGLLFPEAQNPEYQFALETPPTELVVGIWSQLEDGLSSLQTRYFSIWPFMPYDPIDDPRQTHPGTLQGWTKRERNLNMTRAVTRNGRFLSSRSYSCPVNLSAAALPSDVVSSCNLEESTYVKYELPLTDLCEPKGGVPCHTGARLVERETVFETDLNGSTPRWILRQSSDYDGLGHFRVSVLSSSFPSDQPSTKLTDYNSGNGTLLLNENGGVQQDIAELPDPWILNTFTRKTVSEGGVTLGGESCFDPDTGRLLYERTWEGSSAGLKDVLIGYGYDPSGELTSESHYGADTGNVPVVNDLCQISGLPAADFTVRSTYQSGLMTRRYVEGQTLNEMHRTVDAATGWTKTSILETGEVRTFGYDIMGRVTSITGPATASSQILYRRVDTGAVKTWQVESRSFPKGTALGNTAANFCSNPSAGGNQPLTVLCTDLDELGRTRFEKALRPGNVWGSQTRTYHKSGLLASVTSINEPNKSATLTYDYKGRLRRKNRPDGSTVRMSYTGVRKERITTEVLGTGGITEVITKKTLDPEDRLVSVESPNHFTQFLYDPLGQRLRSIRKANPGASVKQERIFKIDGRGFVTSENIPEMDVKTVSSNFNTRGQARRVEQGSRIQKWKFDVLGRPTELEVSGKVLKTWEYGTTGSSNGRLIEAVRNNYRTALTNAIPQAGNYEVTSTYQHDAAGRVSSRTISLVYIPDGVPPLAPASFTQSWKYDDLGNVDLLTYPTCNSACQLEARTVDYNYTRGLLSTVVEPGLGASLSYHPDGTLYRVTHNGIAGVDTYGADSSGMSRVGSVSLGGGTLNLGSYSYDRSGNVTAIGSDTFRYDETSRLVDARVRGRHYVNTFDQFDNITSFGTIDQATNRFSSPVIVYDIYGNMTVGSGGIDIAYDELDKTIKVSTPSGDDTVSVYDHDDLRILMAVSGSPQRWTLRDLAGRVLREFEGGGSDRIQTKDYVYAGNRQLSSKEYDGTDQVIRHYHTDHQGTARLITNADGTRTQQHFGPFGSVIADASFEQLTYTGHEENGDGFTYYMRSRNYLPASFLADGIYYEGGKFLQVDPAGDGWNLYAYVSNNPLRFTDPTGEERDDESAIESLRLFFEVILTQASSDATAEAATQLAEAEAREQMARESMELLAEDMFKFNRMFSQAATGEEKAALGLMKSVLKNQSIKGTIEVESAAAGVWRAGLRVGLTQFLTKVNIALIFADPAIRIFRRYEYEMVDRELAGSTANSPGYEMSIDIRKKRAEQVKAADRELARQQEDLEKAKNSLVLLD